MSQSCIGTQSYNLSRYLPLWSEARAVYSTDRVNVVIYLREARDIYDTFKKLRIKHRASIR